MRHEELVRQITAGYQTKDPPGGLYRRVLNSRGKPIAWIYPVGDKPCPGGSDPSGPDGCSWNCEVRVMLLADMLGAPQDLRRHLRPAGRGCEQIYVRKGIGRVPSGLLEARALLAYIVENPGVRGVKPAVFSKSARRFGIEAEFYGVRKRDALAAVRDLGMQMGLGSWNVVTDMSVSGIGTGHAWGNELVSPPLVGESGWDALSQQLQMLDLMGAKVNRTCGVHVHMDVADTRLPGLKRFVYLWHQNQDLIDWMVSASRRHNHHLVRRWHEGEVQRVMGLRAIRGAGRFGRYRVVNIGSYPVRGTVEVRQLQGTMQIEKIRPWVGFAQAMLDTAARAKGPDELRKYETLPAMLAGVGCEEEEQEALLARARHFRAPEGILAHA